MPGYKLHFIRPSIEVLEDRNQPNNLMSVVENGLADFRAEHVQHHQDRLFTPPKQAVSIHSDLLSLLPTSAPPERKVNQQNKTLLNSAKDGLKFDFGVARSPSSLVSATSLDRTSYNRDTPSAGQASNIQLPTAKLFATPVINSNTNSQSDVLFSYLMSQSAGSKKVPLNDNIQMAARSESVGTVTQDVPINCDNDNGSVVTNTIPATRDFSVGGTANENDLVPLTTHWVLLNPPVGKTPFPPITKSWSLWQSGGQPAALKMWTTAQKGALVPLSGGGEFPPVWLEGIEPSKDLSDTISIDALWDWTYGNGYVAHYQLKTVVATVTPVVKYSNITGLAPDAVTINGVKSIVNGFKAEAYFNSELYIGSYFNSSGAALNGAPRYIQTWDAMSHDLSDGIIFTVEHDLKFNDGSRLREDLKPTTGQGSQPGPNFTFPFLDKRTAPPAPYNDPYYDIPSYSDQITSINASTVKVSVNDSPGRGADPVYSNLSKIGFTYGFSTFLVWAHSDTAHSETLTTYSLGYINWGVKFAWVAVNGNPVGNNAGSLLYDTTGFVPHHSNPLMLKPTIANDATKNNVV